LIGGKEEREREREREKRGDGGKISLFLGAKVTYFS
jgi:hypothetical protein